MARGDLVALMCSHLARGRQAGGPASRLLALLRDPTHFTRLTITEIADESPAGQTGKGLYRIAV